MTGSLSLYCRYQCLVASLTSDLVMGFMHGCLWNIQNSLNLRQCLILSSLSLTQDLSSSLQRYCHLLSLMCVIPIVSNSLVSYFLCLCVCVCVCVLAGDIPGQVPALSLSQVYFYARKGRKTAQELYSEY